MEGFNIKFVGVVEKHPVIYNYTLQGYLRKDITERAWNEVAKEMNLPASECKEKWRNLRSTLAKNLKPKPSGSGATKKKPYYLTDAMQFAIPFIKVAGTSSGNLPAIPKQIVESDEESLDDTQQIDFSGDSSSVINNQRTVDDHPQLPSSPSLPPITPTPRPPPLTPQTGLPSKITTEPVSSPVAATTGPKGRKRKRPDSQSDVDKEFATYFRAKTAEITKKSSPNENSVRMEGIQSFLNSLIPDLLPMTNYEFSREKPYCSWKKFWMLKFWTTTPLPAKELPRSYQLTERQHQPCSTPHTMFYLQMVVLLRNHLSSLNAPKLAPPLETMTNSYTQRCKL